MTKKDYTLIAEAMLAARPHARDPMAAKNTWTNAVNELANRMRHENPRFDRHTFVSHCGMNTGWYEDRGDA